MARKLIKNIVFIFVFILFNIFISYGEYSIFGVEGLVNTLDNSINNIHFIELGDKEIGVNKHTNEVILGWSYDENGDLIYTDNNLGPGISGLTLLDLELLDYNNLEIYKDKNLNSFYFNELGKWINPGIDYDKNYIDSMKQLESVGYTEIVGDKRTLDEYLTIFYNDFCLMYNDCPITIINLDNGYRLEIPKDRIYNRDDIINKIIDYYGNINGVNPYEHIVDICYKLMDLNFNYSNMNISLEESLYSKKGVCFHYARIAKILLENLGYEVESISCKYKGSNQSHMVLRIKVDNKWVYSDPSALKSDGFKSMIMDYNYFLDTYELVDYVILDEYK